MNKKLLIITIYILTIGSLYAQNCSTLDCIADGLIPQVKSVLSFIDGFSYIMGIVFGIKGAFKLKEHSESKGQVKLSIGIVMLIAAACFISLPSLINIGIETTGLDTAGAKKLGQF